jgi:signal transduction histidine kinase
MATVHDPPISPFADALLCAAPADVVFFDAGLICRYVAPAGDTVLGRPAADLLGLGPADIFTGAIAVVTPRVVAAARVGASWEASDLTWPDPNEPDAPPSRWLVRVMPLSVEGVEGVIVTWCERLSGAEQLARLEREVEQLHRQRQQRQQALLALFSDVRNLITPISGYLQVIVRRPATLGGRSPADVIVTHILPRVADLLAALERLREPPITDEPR